MLGLLEIVIDIFSIFFFWKPKFAQAHYFCPHCRKTRAFTRRASNHWFHFRLTLITFCLWGLVWLLVLVRDSNRPFTCSFCGYKNYERLRKNP
jgi:hypothetical protein